MKVKYLILGAGPCGLALANCLKRKGEESFLVLEKESSAGGLCRSKMVDGSGLDIGGGHFLDVRRPKVCDFAFSFMGIEEWDSFERDSKIAIHNTYVGHPFEANIWQLDKEYQDKYLSSIKEAGCNNNKPEPDKFTEWIRWKLGDEIANNYMLPYNTKMFGGELDSLGTYWLEKLPNVSYEETLASCKDHKAYGTQPGHAKFYYPKRYGFGELFDRMAVELGERIIFNEPVTKLEVDNKKVNDTYEADVIITTIPWTDIKEITGLSRQAMDGIKSLKHTGIYVDYYEDTIDDSAQWIYYPDINLSYHRILVRHNFLIGSKGYWTETNIDRHSEVDIRKEYSFKNEYAYPLNTIGKNETMDMILKEAGANNVIGLGRWGEWQHYNSDLVIKKAMDLAHEL